MAPPSDWPFVTPAARRSPVLARARRLPALIGVWITPGILEALIPGRIQGHGGTAEVSGGAA